MHSLLGSPVDYSTSAFVPVTATYRERYMVEWHVHVAVGGLMHFNPLPVRVQFYTVLLRVSFSIKTQTSILDEG